MKFPRFVGVSGVIRDYRHIRLLSNRKFLSRARSVWMGTNSLSIFANSNRNFNEYYIKSFIFSHFSLILLFFSIKKFSFFFVFSFRLVFTFLSLYKKLLLFLLTFFFSFQRLKDIISFLISLYFVHAFNRNVSYAIRRLARDRNDFIYLFCGLIPNSRLSTSMSIWLVPFFCFLRFLSFFFLHTSWTLKTIPFTNNTITQFVHSKSLNSPRESRVLWNVFEAIFSEVAT